MLKLNYLLIFIIPFFSFNNYLKKEMNVNETKHINQKGGVLLTFDDDYVDEWSKLNVRLNQYNWKGTFYISHFDKLNNKQIRQLRLLQKNKNEIAAHGLNHLHTTRFIHEFGENKFIQQEITPMLTLMKKKGINVTNFSYPYGDRNVESDHLLLKYFTTLRGTVYGNVTPAMQHCYYQNKQLFYGIGIDNSYPHFNLPYFISLLEYAKEHNKIVVFYAHKTVEKATNKYETEYKTLEDICKFVNNNNMKFYTVSDLQFVK